MLKVLSSILIVLFSLPVQAEIVSRPVEYKHAEAVFQGFLVYDDTWKDRRPGVLVHSFTNPDADKAGMKAIAYNQRADRRSWEHMQFFFKEILHRGVVRTGRPIQA
jgi:hypothetical protein